MPIQEYFRRKENKNDFANKSQFTFKDVLGLEVNTRIIVFTAVMLALFILFSFISHYIGTFLVIFPTVGFLKLEFVSFLLIVSAMVVGLSWTTLIIVVGLAVRLGFDFDPVGLFSLLIAYCVYVWFFCLIYFYTMKAVHLIVGGRSALPKWKWNAITGSVHLAALIMATLITAVLLTLFNLWFIFRIYGLYLKINVAAFYKLWPFVFAFNIVKYGVNSGVAWLIRIPLIYLINHHQVTPWFANSIKKPVIKQNHNDILPTAHFLH